MIERTVDNKLAEISSDIEESSKNLELQKQKYDEAVQEYSQLKEQHEKFITEHMNLLQEYEKNIELQKIYVYLIPKLIQSSGLDIPEDFDVSRYEDAKSLYTKYLTGEIY